MITERNYGTTGPWSKIVVGVLTRVTPHPAANREVVTEVDVGWASFTVVTGGPGIEVGRKVALALPGARVINPQAAMPRLSKLKRRRIRGIVSEGMLCSAKELGIGEDHTAVYLLDATAPIGVPLGQIIDSSYRSEACVEPTPLLWAKGGSDGAGSTR
jgi:phenylalanyl-tRNA synthetase beta chain